MRGFPPPPPPVCPDRGDPIRGKIKNGKKFPFGCVQEEQYNDDLDELREEIEGRAAGTTVTEMQNSINTLSAKADNLEEDISEHAEALESLSGNIQTMQATIVDLQYSPITIISLTCSPAVAEMGSTVAEVTVSWSLSKATNTVKINDTDVTGTSKKYTGVTSAQTFVLAVTDERNASASKSAAISFVNQIYFGVAENSSSITSLSKILSGDRKRDINVNATSGKYIYYAYPKRLGTASFFVGGFQGGFEDPETKSVTNASGYAEDYYIYRSGNANLGNVTVTIK